jgi:hypothetical protein
MLLLLWRRRIACLVNATEGLSEEIIGAVRQRTNKEEATRMDPNVRLQRTTMEVLYDVKK